MTRHRSLWRDTAETPGFAPLREDREVDVTVVGAGITGLTTAWCLRDAGLRVAVIERDRVASGVTGRTTGHLTTLPDGRLHELAKSFGVETAAQVVGAMRGGIDFVERLVSELGADCDFARVDGWLWAARPEDRSVLERELEAGRQAGLDATLEEQTPLPFRAGPGLRVPRQARFHPVKYLAALSRAVADAGVPIFEGTRAHHLRAGEPLRIETEDGVCITTGQVVLATHTPAGIDMLQAAAAPYRSYAVAFRPTGAVPEGLFWDTAEPYHYVRPQGDLLVVGGADHKTGAGSETDSYRALEAWIRSRFDVEETCWRWSAQVYEPADGLPFVGRRATNRDVWVATGFSGDGLVWGTVAGTVLASRILDRPHEHAELLDTKRFAVRAGGGRFVKENLDAAKHFVSDRLAAFGEGRVEDVELGEGKILRRGTEVLAVYRASDGRLHVRNAVCPHLKCVVQWNGAERSWDCPCHGSRFDVEGRVMEGPSMHDLHVADGGED